MPERSPERSIEDLSRDELIRELQRLREALAERVAMAQEQKRLGDEQRFFAEVGNILASSLEYEDTTANMVQLVVREIADFAALYPLEEDGEPNRPQSASRDPAQAWFGELFMGTPDRQRWHHPVWQIIETKRPVIMDVTVEMLVAFSPQRARSGELAAPVSVIGMPLLVGQKCIGALFLGSSGRAYGPQDLVLAEEFGRRAALFLENARLHRAARRAIQARDDVLGIVAHDLRNPLSSIVMHTALLGRRGAEPDRRSRKPILAIERAAHRMNHLIQDLLDVARLEAGHLAIDRTRIATGQVVAEFVETQRPLAASRSIELRTEIAADLGEVLADRERFLQVLENLVSNAVRFTDAKGLVTVGVRPRGDELLFWVADTGVGIEAADLPRLFDWFWQARRVGRQGAGLGLPIVKGIVEAHGGKVWVESQPGLGSTFYFSLPLAGAAPAVIPAVLPAERSTRAVPSSHVVLVVEDDLDVREGLCEALAQAGYEVVAASNGREALTYLRKGPRPSLILLDLRMPVLDGWGFLVERNQDAGLRELPVLVISGERDAEERVAAAHAAYLAKPVETARLLAAMDQLVR